MGRYLLRRLVVAALTVVVVMAALALLSASTPGEPARAMLGPRATPQLIAQVRVAMHLNDSVPEQVWIFMRDAAQGDLGTDYINGIPVWDLVRDSLISTAVLALTSLGLAIALGVPLGVLAAARPGSVLDRVLGFFSVSLVSVPPFVVALLFVLLFSVRLGWLPSSGDGSASDPVGYLEHLLMPAIALAAGWVGYLARLVRASMLEDRGAVHPHGRGLWAERSPDPVPIRAAKRLDPVVAVLVSPLAPSSQGR